MHCDTSGHGGTDILSKFVRREPKREKAMTAVQTELQMTVLKEKEVQPLSKMVKRERVGKKVQKLIQEEVMNQFKTQRKSSKKNLERQEWMQEKNYAIGNNIDIIARVIIIVNECNNSG